MPTVVISFMTSPLGCRSSPHTSIVALPCLSEQGKSLPYAAVQQAALDARVLQ
jgi:hypothetical protein